MARYMHVDGIFEVPDDMDQDQFWLKLIDWVEANTYRFGGGMEEQDEMGEPVRKEAGAEGDPVEG